MRLPDQHIANCILPPELIPNIFIISTVCSHTMSKVTKLIYKAMFFISKLNSCWVKALWLLWSDQHWYCFRCVVFNVPTVSEEQLPFAQVTSYHLHNSVNLPRRLFHSTLLLWRGCDGLGYLHIHYTATVTTSTTQVRATQKQQQQLSHWPIQIEQWNVIDNELTHHTIYSCSLFQNINNFIICKST